MARNNELRLRLSAKGKEELIDALRGMGREANRAADQIERAGRKGSRGLKLIDNAAKGLKGELQSTASRIPILGSAVQGMSVQFLAGAAAVGALTVALAAALRIARGAVREFDAIAKRSDDLGFSTDFFQGLQELARQESVPLERLNTALSTFARNSSRAATGRGEMVEMLRATHPELLREISLLDSSDERLSRYAQALQEAETQTERNLLATAAFGESGFEVARMLADLEDGIESFIDDAREMGLVVDEDILRRSEEMETRMTVAARVIDLNLKQAFIELAPVLVETAELLADVARWIRDVSDAATDFFTTDDLEAAAGLQGVADRLYSGDPYLQTRRSLQHAVSSAVGGGEQGERLSAMFSGLETDWLGRLTEESRVFAASLLDDLAGARRRIAALREEDEGEGEGEDGEDLQRMIELQQHVTEVRAGAATSAEQLAASLAMLREAREAGIIQSDEELARLEASMRARHHDAAAVREQEQAELQAARARAELGDFTGLLAIRERELGEMVERGALEREEAEALLAAYEQRLQSSNAETRRAAQITESVQTPLERYQANLAELDALLARNKITQEVHTRAVAAATEVYQAADPAFQTAADVRREMMTLDQRLAAEEERVAEAVRTAGLDADLAAEYLERYAEMQREAADRTSELRFETELLDRVLNKQIETWEDLGRVALQVLADIIRQQTLAADSSQGFGAFIRQIISGTIGAIIPGASSTTAAASASQSSFGWSSGFIPTASSAAATSAAASAPSSQLVPAAAPPTELGLNVSIKNETGQEVEARERRSSDGTATLELWLKQAVKSWIQDGEFDDDFAVAFGASRQPALR
ncbi:hypothetical protein [Hyphobacterium sp.]|uniref:hypothetical protein n=1 Tax=Hyphobacterium sp. TaxID=2004662 RepID=UPI003BABCD5F